MMDVYILKSCDSCRKAIKNLSENGVDHTIFDIRQDAIGEDVIHNAIAVLGWEAVLNRRSTSWRALSDSQKENMDAAKAAQLINDNPTLMKRPLFISGQTYIVGFDKAAQEKLGL